MKKGNHVSYRGVPIDIEALKNENENVPAMGNMNVNAKGDVLGKGGTIAKTVDEVARDHHRVRTAIKHTGLKGPQPENPALEDKTKKRQPPASAYATGASMPPRQPKETEAENRDITIEEDKNENATTKQ